MSTTTTTTTNAALAAAEAAYNAARNAVAIADAEAAEAARLADPIEVAHDAAAQAVVDARAAVVPLLRLAGEAKREETTATASYNALILATVAGQVPDDKAIHGAAQAVQKATARAAFFAAAASAGQDAVTDALFNQTQANARYNTEKLNRRDLAALAKTRAAYPDQPDDDVLRAELAKTPGLVERWHNEASLSHDLAYNTGTARQRIIAEGRAYSRARIDAMTVNADLPRHLWADRSILRQIRFSMAAAKHWAKYPALSFDQKGQLDRADYRFSVPTWDGIALTFAPLL